MYDPWVHLAMRNGGPHVSIAKMLYVRPGCVNILWFSIVICCWFLFPHQCTDCMGDHLRNDLLCVEQDIKPYSRLGKLLCC